MKSRWVIKYFLLGIMATALAGPVVAQNNRQNRKKSKTESVAKDTLRVQTLTHTTPVIGVHVPPAPQRKKFLVGHVDDSYRVDVNAAANMGVGTPRAIFAPVIVANPFVKFCDKYTVGAHANIMLHNFTGNNFSPVVYEMYLDGVADTKVGKFEIKIGKFIAINFDNDFSKYMPVHDQLMTNIHFAPGWNLKRAATFTYRGQEASFGLGYAENHDGFGVDGDGKIVMIMSQNIGEYFQIGGTIQFNKTDSRIDSYIDWAPTYRNIVFIRVTDIGGRAMFYGTFGHAICDNDATIALNGYVQSGDGARGANIGFYHTKSGAYIATGATYHDPMHGTNMDGTPNPQYDKWSPFVEIGIKKTLVPRARTR